MALLRTFATRREADRAAGFLRRSHITARITEHDEGWGLEVADGRQEVAEEMLGALGRLSLEGMGKPSWRERLFNLENLGVIVWGAIGLILAGVFVLGVWVSIWWVGIEGFLLLVFFGTLYLQFGGITAAIHSPPKVSSRHGPVSQDEAAVHSYRRGWVRQVWWQANWRKALGYEKQPLEERWAPQSADDSDPTPFQKCGDRETQFARSLLRCPRCGWT